MVTLVSTEQGGSEVTENTPDDDEVTGHGDKHHSSEEPCPGELHLQWHSGSSGSSSRADSLK